MAVETTQKNLSSGGGSTSGGKTRQPIVVVMGHVDHGKTSLLDYIRKARTAAKEAGGITQSIGAYEAEFNGKKITFIDTPGHEAFSKMRARGAQAADLAVLVVAAEEGVKPQTKEVIKVLKQSKTPFVVAINKIDKTGGDMEKVKSDLMAEEVFLEGSGGDVSFHGISAKTGEGINELLELIVLATEVENLTYDPLAHPSGYILETKMNKNRGIETTVIVKNGILKKGDDIATPSARGKVKILEDFMGKQVNEIPAGSPALVMGFESMSQVGEEFISRDIGELKIRENVFPAMREDLDPDEKTLRLILKSSDKGSLEALHDIITYLDPDKPLRIVGESVGEVSENDVKMAISSGASIIGFKTKIDKAAIRLAEPHKIKIIVSEVIYDLVKTVQDFFVKLHEKTSVGELEVLAIFNQEKNNKQVVGGRVIHGNFKNRMQFQIKRLIPVSADAEALTSKEIAAGKDNEIVGMGRVTSLQTNKKDAGSVPEGSEAGLIVSSEILLAVGDHLIIPEE